MGFNQIIKNKKFQVTEYKQNWDCGAVSVPKTERKHDQITCFNTDKKLQKNRK